jgi:Flp pilus assembly protein TadG
MPGHRHRRHADRGAVTVETAIALASFVLLLAMALSALGAAADQVRCVDAAREAARLTARGEPERARTAAEHIAPRGAEVTITVKDEHIEVEVRAAPLGGLLPGIHLRAEAFATREPHR